MIGKSPLNEARQIGYAPPGHAPPGSAWIRRAGARRLLPQPRRRMAQAAPVSASIRAIASVSGS